MSTIYKQLKANSLNARKIAMKTRNDDSAVESYEEAVTKSSILTTVIGKLENLSKVHGDSQLEDDMVMQFIKSYVKALKDNEHRRPNEDREIVILEEYLPSVASDEELLAVINTEIVNADEVSMRLIGPIMKAIKDKFGPVGFDGKRASELVREQLNV